MRLINLDDLDLSGKPAVAKYLDKWVREHPVTEIIVKEIDEWEVILRKKEAAKNSGLEGCIHDLLTAFFN